MSTYYAFHCKKHQVQGGWMSRQAWGTGNFDIIDSFKFVMFHTLECGPENVGVHCEYDSDCASWPDTNSSGGPDDNGDTRRQHLADTAKIWPHSDDWGFMERHPGKDVWDKWQEHEIEQLGKW